MQPQMNPTVHSQRVPYSEHQQPLHRIQTDDWPGYPAGISTPRERASPILIPQHRDSIHLPPHIRSQSPLVTQLVGETPQVVLVFTFDFLQIKILNLIVDFCCTRC